LRTVLDPEHKARLVLRQSSRCSGDGVLEGKKERAQWPATVERFLETTKWRKSTHTQRSQRRLKAKSREIRKPPTSDPSVRNNNNRWSERQRGTGAPSFSAIRDGMPTCSRGSSKNQRRGRGYPASDKAGEEKKEAGLRRRHHAKGKVSIAEVERPKNGGKK